jgi:hypothetical protein
LGEVARRAGGGTPLRDEPKPKGQNRVIGLYKADPSWAQTRPDDG